MTTSPERSHDIYMPLGFYKPDNFRFLAGKMLDALKDYDCSPKRSGDTYSPKGDYIQIAPGLIVFACHLKQICQQEAKDQVIEACISSFLTLVCGDTSYILKNQKVNPERVFVATLHNGNKPIDDTTPPDPWLVKACSKDEARPQYVHPWGNMATDGIRLHIDNSLQPSDPPFPRDYSFVVTPARNYGNIATIRVKPFIQAVKQARTINKNMIRLAINGRLDIIASDPSWNGEDTGKTIISIESDYEHTGNDATIAINPKFLMDALSGFSDEVYLAVDDYYPEQRAIYLTNGTREAVIMTIKPG
jgi:hypothetical protein